jgi:phage protein D
MEVYELAHQFYAPTFSIEVGGKDLLELGVEIFSVTVNNTLKGADDFSFTINNPIDPGAKDFRYLKEKLFSLDFDDPKNEVVIKMGYGDRSKLTQVFSGIITAVDLTFPANGVSQMTIKGYDRSHKMMKDQHSDSWGSDNNFVSYSDVVEKIAQKPCYQFGVSNIEKTKDKHRLIKQDRQSDYDFIQQKLAKEISYEFFVIDKDIYFRSRKNNKETFTAELIWGRTLISFSPKINTANQISEVQVRGWDSAQQKPIIGKAKSGGEKGKEAGSRTGGQTIVCGSQGVVKEVCQPVSTQKEADDLAKSILENIALEYITGSGECLGLPGNLKEGAKTTPSIIAGEIISLKGLGETFSKKYYVEKVSHSISTSGFKTTFEITENSLNEKTL